MFDGKILKIKRGQGMKIHGHETFCIRKGWLRKGVKSIQKYPRLFTDKNNNPCDILGMGTNMVKSLRYWMSAVGIMEEVSENNQKIYRLTELGNLIDSNDKYFEEDGTLWALHYMLAKNKEQATAWYWIFNLCRINTFDKTYLMNEFNDYLKTEYGYDCPKKTLEDEFDCLLRTYLLRDKDISPESTLVCPLTSLHLIEQEEKKVYKKITPDKDSLHPLIVYGVICDRATNDEILISDLMNEECDIAKIFNFDRSTCFYYLEQLQRMGLLTISRTAGLDVIKIHNKTTFNGALNLYYNSINGDNIGWKTLAK